MTVWLSTHTGKTASVNTTLIWSSSCRSSAAPWSSWGEFWVREKWKIEFRLMFRPSRRSSTWCCDVLKYSELLLVFCFFFKGRNIRSNSWHQLFKDKWSVVLWECVVTPAMHLFCNANVLTNKIFILPHHHQMHYTIQALTIAQNCGRRASPTRISQSSDVRGSTKTWWTDETWWHDFKKPWGIHDKPWVNKNTSSSARGSNRQADNQTNASLWRCTCSPSFRPNFSPSCRHSSTWWLSWMDEVLLGLQLRKTEEPSPQVNSRAWFFEQRQKRAILIFFPLTVMVLYSILSQSLDQ